MTLVVKRQLPLHTKKAMHSHSWLTRGNPLDPHTLKDVLNKVQEQPKIPVEIVVVDKSYHGHIIDFIKFMFLA